MSTPSAIFTIVSANYIAFAATLMQSLRQFHPGIPRFIILSDAMQSFDGLDLAAELIACDDLGIALIGNMKLWYSVIEFNTAVKPFTFRHLFTERGFAAAIYLDPDIQLHAPLDDVFAGLQDHSLVLTPHMMKPLQDGKRPSDHAILKAGVYNLGFAAVKNDADGRGLVDWWCDRLFAHCRVDVPGNLFTDQRWMDLAPVFVERPLILRHPGYNVAYWNLLHRTVTRDGSGEWQCNGSPLVFFHFSGIQPENPTLFSKHQDRFTIETLGQVAELCAEYRARVLANGWLTYNKLPYAYAAFGDGRPILEPMRRWLLRAIDDNRMAPGKPLRIGSAFFDAADDETFAGGGRLTRFAHQMWRERLDLQGSFNLQQEAGFNGYVAWFCDASAEHEGLPPALILAARALRDGRGPPKHAPPVPVLPPWPPLSSEAWTGPASQVADWLKGEVYFELGYRSLRLQRQAALLWERRIDLQQYFKLVTSDAVEQFHLWALTDGMREGSISADFFTAEYLAWLDAPSSISRLYKEVPITNGMALTRRSYHCRAGMHNWMQFPLEPASRIEHAFWYAYVAAKAFGWPPAMIASVRHAMAAPSDIQLDGFTFPQCLTAIYAIRSDVMAAFDLGTDAGRWKYLCWIVTQGAREYGLDPVELCPGIAAFLATASPSHRQLSRLAELVYQLRDDLQAAFNLNTRTGLGGMLTWVRDELPIWLAGQGLSSLLAQDGSPASSPAAPTIEVLAALTGDWDAPSGVGEDLRSSAAALDACGFTDYVIVNLNAGTILRPDGTVLPAGVAVQAEWNVVHHNAETAAADWATLRAMQVSARRVAGHWHWELERLPSRWRHAYSFFDEIWASSRFAAQAFAAEALRPVRCLNGAVTVPERTEPMRRSRFGLYPDATLFLFIFDWASYATRKNPQAVVRAFALAFPLGTERVQLLIKTQGAMLRPELWAELVAEINDERIVLRDERLSRDELVSLIVSADAFVSLHRAEGYGRVPAEAMLLGVPVILTGYSGVMDFADAGTACIVNYTLVPVALEEYPGVEQQRWADADVADAARHMRWIHDQPEAARAMALRGQQRIKHELSPAKVGAAMIEMLTNDAAARYEA